MTNYKIVLWATRKGEADWKEDLITSNAEQILFAMQWAKQNGFDRLRIAVYQDGEAPNFNHAFGITK